MASRKSLFDAGPPETPSGPLSGLFADIVFDRPLDHAFTYSVPDALAAAIGVGKRVEVPLGKGGKPTSGFCVRVKDERPASTFPIKPVTRVLDEDALVDDHLMKLTRWMADYYLCGWGQVLHAVVPAGVRDRAGTRMAAFVEPVPKTNSPTRSPPSRRSRRTHWSYSRTRAIRSKSWSSPASPVHRGGHPRARDEGARAEVQ